MRDLSALLRAAGWLGLSLATCACGRTGFERLTGSPLWQGDPRLTADGAGLTADDTTSDLEPGDVEPGDMEPGDVEPGDVEPGDVEPGDVEPGDVEPGDVEPGDSEPGDAEGGDAGAGGDGSVGQLLRAPVGIVLEPCPGGLCCAGEGVGLSWDPQAAAKYFVVRWTCSMSQQSSGQLTETLYEDALDYPVGIGWACGFLTDNYEVCACDLEQCLCASIPPPVPGVCGGGCCDWS